MSVFKNVTDLAGPVLSRWLSEYITDKDAEIEQGMWLLALLMLSEAREQMMCEFIHFYNHCLGLKSRHSVQCMMLRKVIKRTESVQKNFGPRAAHQVMHSVSRCLNIWDMQQFYEAPMTFCFCAYRLYCIMGWSAAIVVVMIYGMG
jgi:hypothetical protein